MAEPFQKSTVWQQLRDLGRLLSDFGRTIEGKGPLHSHEGATEPDLQLPLMLPAPSRNAENPQLLTQHTPGWHVPHLRQLPVPTYAPAMTAFGIVFLALGAVTVWPLSLVGAIIFFLAVAKWIGELLHD